MDDTFWRPWPYQSVQKLYAANWYQLFRPAGSTFARDGIGAVYEMLGSRLSGRTG